MARKGKDSGIISLTRSQVDLVRNISSNPEMKGSEGGHDPITKAAQPRQQDSNNPPAEDLSLGVVRYLIQEEHITSTQLEYTKKVQEKPDMPRRLSAVLREVGCVGEAEIRETLRRIGHPPGEWNHESGKGNHLHS